jgi:putative transposase
MARIARVAVPGMPHNATQRCDRRLQTFFGQDDYRAYLDVMAEWCSQCKVEIWGYCLMPNHVHLIAVPDSKDVLRRATGEAYRRYTRRVNSRERWRGRLWQSRFASSVMGEAKVAPLLRLMPDWLGFLQPGMEAAEIKLLRRHERTGRPLGGESFLRSLETRLGRILRPMKPGPKRGGNAR